MIRVYDFEISNESLLNVKDCLETSFVSSESPYVSKFEEKFSSYVNCDYGCTTNSGTSALHLSLEVLGITKGDEVILPNYSGVYASIATLLVGATPIYVDIDHTWTIDPLKIESKITSKTKAIIPVHINGNPSDMDKINLLAKKYNLYVIEDAAQAIGSTYRNKKVGSLGDMGCFSFFANKLVTSGEGGMLVTKKEEWAERAKYLASMCYPKYDIVKSFNHKDLGFNYKMSGLSAALGLGQFSKLDDTIKIHQDVYRRYQESLKDYLVFPEEQTNASMIPWMPLVYSESVKGERVVENLYLKGIQSRTAYTSNNKMKALDSYSVSGDYTISEKLAKHGFILPLGYHLKESHFEKIITEVKRIVNE